MLLTLGTEYRVFFRRTSTQVNFRVTSHTSCAQSLPRILVISSHRKNGHGMKPAGRKKIVCLTSDKWALSARFSSFHLATRDNIRDGLHCGHASRASLDTGPPRESTACHVTISFCPIYALTEIITVKGVKLLQRIFSRVKAVTIFRILLTPTRAAFKQRHTPTILLRLCHSKEICLNKVEKFVYLVFR